MDEAAIGKALVWAVGGLGSLWAGYQLFRAVWGLKADSDKVTALGDKESKDVAALHGRMDEFKADLHKLRGSAVTQEQIRERKEEVDRQLEARRQGEIALHQKVDSHAEQDREMFNAILGEIRQIGASVARIEGRLER